MHVLRELTPCSEQLVILKEQNLPGYLRWNLKRDMFEMALHPFIKRGGEISYSFHIEAFKTTA